MSVLIKGMEMPKDCFDCMFDEFCTKECNNPPPKDKTKCPLVEIPTPHGRLIDADDLKEMENWAEYVVVENAPTVIEEDL